MSYNLHHDVDLSKVEKIVWIPDSTKADLAKAEILAGNVPSLGTKINAEIQEYQNGFLLEKVGVNPFAPDGSELWLDGVKIWPFYRDPLIRLSAYKYGSWQLKQSFGHAVAISEVKVSETAAVGSPNDGPNGSAEAYSFSRAKRTLDPIGSGGFNGAGFNNRDKYGCSVDVNYDGTVMAVGAHQHEKAFCQTSSGYVVVKELVDHTEVTYERKSGGFSWTRGKKYTKTTKKWVQKGQTIGGDRLDKVGWKVKLSADGNTLAISCVHPYQEVCHQTRNSTDTGWVLSPKLFHRGHVKIYTYDAATKRWIQKGPTLAGAEEWEGFGIGLDMTPDGDCIVVGSPYYKCNEDNRSGRVQVFKFSGGEWKRAGHSILPYDLYINNNGDIMEVGDAGYTQPDWSNARFGWSVAISASGEKVAIGSPLTSGGGSINTFGYNIKDAETDIRPGWYKHRNARRDVNNIEKSSDMGGFGWDISMNDSGSLLAVSMPGLSHLYPNWAVGNDLENAGGVAVFGWVNDLHGWGTGAANPKPFFTYYGLSAGDFTANSIDLSPSGNDLIVGSPRALDRSDSNWDLHDANSAREYGDVTIWNITDLIRDFEENGHLTTGQSSIAFNILNDLTPSGTKLITSDPERCSPPADPEDLNPGPKEPIPEEEEADKNDTSTSEPENPKKDPPGSPPKDVGAPVSIEVDGEIKKVHVTKTGTVVYVTDWIDPTDCECVIDNGKENTTTTDQTYDPPDDGIMVAIDGTVTELTKNTPVYVPPGATTYVKKSPELRRINPNRWPCPHIENWNHYMGDCRHHAPGGPLDPEGRLGGRTDGGTYNGAVTPYLKIPLTRGFVTTSNSDGTVGYQDFEAGEQVTVGPGQFIYQEGSGNDDAGYTGGTYTTDTGETVSPSAILDDVDTGRRNNTETVITIEKVTSCAEFCKCLKVKENGETEEFDIREEDIELGPGEALFYGNEKDITGKDPGQSSIGYEGGVYDGVAVDEIPYDDGDPDSGPFLSQPGEGVKNNTTSNTEYQPINNTVVVKDDGTKVKYEVEKDNISSITLEPGDAAFEDVNPPGDRGTLPFQTEDTTITVGDNDIDLDQFIGGSDTRNGVGNKTGEDSNVDVPEGTKGFLYSKDGDISIIDGGQSVTLKPGESMVFGSGKGLDGTTIDDDGMLILETDTGKIPLQNLLGDGNPGLTNNTEDPMPITPPAGKRVTLTGPNNEIIILDDGQPFTLEPGWTMNTGTATDIVGAGYESGEHDGNNIGELMDDPDSGITNNTQEPICVPAVTKKIELSAEDKGGLLDDGDGKATLLNGSAGNFTFAPSRVNMSLLMSKYNISPMTTNPVGISRMTNTFTRIAEPKAADDCEPGYIKLKPGESMFRGKSNGVEDAEYTGGAFTDPNTGLATTTDVGSLVSDPTSGLTNSSGEDKELNLPDGHSGVILDSERRVKVLNGENDKKITLKNGESLIIGEENGVTDAEYNGTGDLNGGGTNVGTFVDDVSSGIKNTSGSDKTVQLGTGSTGIIINDSTGEIEVVNPGGNAVIKSGWTLYEGDDAGISNAGVSDPEDPYHGLKLSDVFTDDVSIREGVKNTSGSTKTLKVPPSGTNAFIFKPDGSFEVVRGYPGGPPPGTITLEDGESLIIGGALEGVKVSTDNLAHGSLSAFYVPSTNWSTRAMGENDTITDGRIGGEFTLNSVNIDFGYKLDTITVNGVASGKTITIDSMDDITIGADISLKTSYNVTLTGNSSATSGGITFTWPNGGYTGGSFSSSPGNASSAGGFSSGAFMEGTELAYQITAQSGYEMSSLSIGGTTVTALTGTITVDQNISVDLNFEANIQTFTVGAISHGVMTLSTSASSVSEGQSISLSVGTDVTVTITPDDGYFVKGFLDDPDTYGYIMHTGSYFQNDDNSTVTISASGVVTIAFNTSIVGANVISTQIETSIMQESQNFEIEFEVDNLDKVYGMENFPPRTNLTIIDDMSTSGGLQPGVFWLNSTTTGTSGGNMRIYSVTKDATNGSWEMQPYKLLGVAGNTSYDYPYEGWGNLRSPRHTLRNFGTQLFFARGEWYNASYSGGGAGNFTQSKDDVHFGYVHSLKLDNNGWVSVAYMSKGDRGQARGAELKGAGDKMIYSSENEGGQYSNAWARETRNRGTVTIFDATDDGYLGGGANDIQGSYLNLDNHESQGLNAFGFIHPDDAQVYNDGNSLAWNTWVGSLSVTKNEKWGVGKWLGLNTLKEGTGLYGQQNLSSIDAVKPDGVNNPRVAICATFTQRPNSSQDLTYGGTDTAPYGVQIMHWHPTIGPNQTSTGSTSGKWTHDGSIVINSEAEASTPFNFPDSPDVGRAELRCEMSPDGNWIIVDFGGMDASNIGREKRVYKRDTAHGVTETGLRWKYMGELNGSAANGDMIWIEIGSQSYLFHSSPYDNTVMGYKTKLSGTSVADLIGGTGVKSVVLTSNAISGKTKWGRYIAANDYVSSADASNAVLCVGHDAGFDVINIESLPWA